jgi:hypothetical protein
MMRDCWVEFYSYFDDDMLGFVVVLLFVVVVLSPKLFLTSDSIHPINLITKDSFNLKKLSLLTIS